MVTEFAPLTFVKPGLDYITAGRVNVNGPKGKLWVKSEEQGFFITRSVAIVGARACSGYGRAVARAMAERLANEGCTIVSGLARGIDGEAHRGALAARTGDTVGVLGCGIDRMYPAVHAELAHEMIDAGGALVSEYEGETEPAPWRFPARNRIIAALADAMVVVEARERSGALIAADFALEYGVPLFAVPGEITSLLSAGTNDLLRRGVAKPYTRPEDVLGVLG